MIFIYFQKQKAFRKVEDTKKTKKGDQHEDN